MNVTVKKRNSVHSSSLCLRVTYEDGTIESVIDDAKSIRSRFRDLVFLYNQHYFGKIKIEVVDYCDKVWKMFVQNY